LTNRTNDGQSAGDDGRSAAVIADGNVFVIRQKRLIRTEELTDARGVIDGRVEVGVVGDVDGFDEIGAGDGVERRLG